MNSDFEPNAESMDNNATDSDIDIISDEEDPKIHKFPSAIDGIMEYIMASQSKTGSNGPRHLGKGRTPKPLASKPSTPELQKRMHDVLESQPATASGTRILLKNPPVSSAACSIVNHMASGYTAGRYIIGVRYTLC